MVPSDAGQVRKVDSLSPDARRELAAQLLQEQVVEARKHLHRWRDITDQPAQVDTGYVAQHLVSLVVGVPGDRMRGKGIDLIDESEIKGANFLDSLDKRGAVAPRWNFPSNDENTMIAYIEVPTIYLTCLDWNSEGRIRARVWALDPHQHLVFRQRYLEWVEHKGIPKLRDPRRPSANFQLFPPKPGSTQTHARHGSNRTGELPPVKINLEEEPGSKIIFHAEEDEQGRIRVLVFAP